VKNDARAGALIHEYNKKIYVCFPKIFSVKNINVIVHTSLLNYFLS